MNKSKIITIILITLFASFISEARAQKPSFDIYVNNKILLNKDKKEDTIKPVTNAVNIEQPIITISPTPQVPQQKQTTPKKTDSRTDFTSIYVSAGERFGINWRILAAVHSVETGQRGDTPVKSYAGAQGPMQFMPATFRAYAIDGDGDGIKNINDVDDAIFTAANYLSSNAQKSGIDYALYRYNHDWNYVNKVKSIAGI